MYKIDITKNNLYIGKILNVIKTGTQKHHKLMHVKCRHSDAFVYILSGSCTYRFVDGCEFTVNDGDILYLAHQEDYTMYIHTADYRYIYCDFEFNEAAPRKSDMYSPHSSSYAENLFDKLFRYKNSFTDALSVLYNIYGTAIITANKVYVGNLSKNRISEAKKYIEANLEDTSLGVSFLAEKADMSEVYFRKLFKSQYHISPAQYIISVRIKKAKELMKYPFLTLEECALQSGFSSLQYFCRVFKNSTGITPSKYRNQK